MNSLVQYLFFLDFCQKQKWVNKSFGFLSRILLTGVLLSLTACVQTETNYAEGADLKPVELDPAKEYFDLGVVYMQQGKYDLSEARLRRSLEIRETPEAYNALALLYETMYDNLSAEKTYEKIIKNYSDYPLGFSNYVVFLCRYERWPQIDSITKSRKVSKEVSAVTHISAGNCYQSHNDIKKAKEQYNKALDKIPLSAGALIPLAEMEYKEGDVLGAKKRIEMVLNQIGYSPKALLLAGMIARDEGDRIKERDYFRTLQVRYPNSPEARSVGAIK